jgi:cobalt-zinc-cadmium efflux system protein
MNPHKHPSTREKNIRWAVFLNVTFTIIELIGGLLTNSLAILSDALHDLGDSVALITSLIAEKKAKKPADLKRTYGYQRLSLFSAVFTTIILITGSFFIISEAIPRLFHPETPDASGMMIIAIIGILANGAGMLKLRTGRSQSEKIISWHLLEDVLGWVAIFIAGVVIYFWDFPIIDPILTLGITAFVLWGVTRNLRDTLNIFMQGVPRNMDINKVKKELEKLNGVLGVHDIHIWSLEGETNIFSGHVVVEDDIMNEPEKTREEIKKVLSRHHIEHSTVEMESRHYCSGIECQSMNLE